MEPATEALEKIAGNIVAHPNPGLALKTWRERFHLKQVLLARAMHISPSVLSDYESGRRASPGVTFIRRYIHALLHLDAQHQHVADQLLTPRDHTAILALAEFPHALAAHRIVTALQGEVLTGAPSLDAPLYGYTVLDSIKAIYALSGYDFYRVFGATTERALVFTEVGRGRSPLVAIRVSQLKPRMVILQRVVDPLAIDLAAKENLILVRSPLPTGQAFVDALRSLTSPPS